LLSGETKLDLITNLDTRLGRMRLEQHLTGAVDLVDERVLERKARSPLRESERGGQ
jgi:hypothetical protein